MSSRTQRRLFQCNELRPLAPPCYGFRLRSSVVPPPLIRAPSRYSNGANRHFSSKLFLKLFCILLAGGSLAHSQINTHALKADLPPQDEIRFHGLTQDSNGNMRYLHKPASIETSEMMISADEIRFNSDTNWAYAQGHVHMEHYVSGDKVDADHAEYNVKTQMGRFYEIDGTAPAKIVASPSVLTTTNPFYFKAAWADRIKTRYILHKGFLTDCSVKKPWWIFQAPVFDVIPGERAIARNTVFRFKGLPIFYLPYFYRPLGKNPRHSGFLTPNVGHSTIFGYIVGGGYYWAINPSYDMTAIGQYYSARGPALRYDFRGKPNEVTDFDFTFYGVKDGGVKNTLYDPTKPANGPANLSQGGEELEFRGKTQIWGFTGQADINYLSSYLFRQAFSYSFVSAVSSEVYSIGYLQRHFQNDLYSLTFEAQRDQLFNTVTQAYQQPNQVIIQKLPSAEFVGRDRTISNGPVPLWFSFDSSAAVLNRQEPIGTVVNFGPAPQTLGTGAMLRLDAQPRVMTEFNFKGFSLNPSVSVGFTDYTNSYGTNSTTYAPVLSCGGYPSCPPTPANNVSLANANLFRKDLDIGIEFRAPSVERIYQPPKWLHLGTKLKHVVELGATYQYLTGIDNFQRVIRFDSRDLLSNTNQVRVQVVNRLYKKGKKGDSQEFLTWRVAQERYFNQSFSGAVLPNQRNIILASEEFSAFAFLDGPRNYSPVLSSLTVSPYSFFSLEWRTEYDPLRRRFIDHALNASARWKKYFASVTDTDISTLPLLVPQANQLTFGGGYGNTNRKGWNAAAIFDYDLLLDRRLFSFVQGSYNSDCCGFSLQWRRFNLGNVAHAIRNDNQYLFSFSVANIGNFGSLARQERIQ